MNFYRPCLDCGRKTRNRARCSKCDMELHGGANLNLAVWRRRSKLERTTHPLCGDCLARGKVTPATQTHHQVRRSTGGALLTDELVTLCTACHARRTAHGE